MAARLRIFWSLVTFFGGLSLGSSAIAQGEAPQTATCVKQICTEGSVGAEPLRSFLDREKTNHPDLEKTMQRYQERLDQVRDLRHQRMKQVMAIVSNPTWLKELLASSTDAALLDLFLTVHPWNEAKAFRNDKMVVIAQPLDPNPGEQPDLIRSLFDRFLALSPLYKIQREYSTLHIDVRKTLGLMATDDLQAALVSKLMVSAANLTPQQRQEFQKRLDRSLNLLKTSARIYGQDAAVFLGELELSNLIKIGRLTLSQTERSLLIQIVYDKFTSRLEEKQQVNLDEIYRKNGWDDKCRMAFNRTLHYGLNKQDADNISSIKSEALRRAMNTSREIFGSKIANQLQKYFQAVDIVGPLSLENYFEATDFALSMELEPWNPKDVTSIYSALYDLRKEGDSGLDNFCNSFIYQPLRDMENGGLVILSSYSLRNFTMGLSIATHEMGHAASEGMKTLMASGEDVSEFLSMRQCINKNYISVDRPFNHLPGDKLWTEEDWADAFSGHSTRDLNAVNTCTFLGAFPQYDYVQLNNRGEDPHSPTFYRILNVSVHAHGKIPNQCSQAVAQEFPGTSFADCLSSH